MNPAFSVIFLTTLIGAGQGLFLALYGIEIAGALQLQSIASGQLLFIAGSVYALY